MAIVGSAFTENADYFGVGDPLSGREAICAFLARVWAARQERNEQTRHLMTNIMILEESVDQVVAVSYFTVIVSSGGVAALGSTGWYEDTLVADGDCWRIRTRTAHRDGQT